MTFHTLRAAERNGGAGNEEARPANQWEVSLPALRGHLVTKTVGGSGVLTVWTVDGVAIDSGLRSGDRLVGFDRKDGKGMQIGLPREMERALKAGPLHVLVERPMPTEPSESPAKGLGERSKRVYSRRSSSQTDHLRRLQRARLMSMGSLPSKSKPDPRPQISEHTHAGAGLFL